MLRALQLAERGRGKVEPNPRVGAVVLDRKGGLAAEGWHSRFGGPHAEVEALKNAGKKARGGTLFVTLEPCSTFGKTPPCTDAILNSGIKRVVVGTQDPDPRHQGRGTRILKSRRISVVTGILQGPAKEQNPEFFKWMKSGIPYVGLKLAQSLDGKIATSRGESKWITSPSSRERVQLLRSLHQAVLVGTETLRKDKPRLALRGIKGRAPRRIFVVRDPNQLSGYLKAQAKEGDLLFFKIPPRFSLKKMRGIPAPFNARGIRIAFLMKTLGREGISSLLVEGGGEMAASFLEGGWADKLYIFIAPILIGGRAAKTGLEGKGIETLAKAFRLERMSVETIGPDILVQGEVRK